MTVPPLLPAKTQARDASQVARQTVSIRTVSPTVPLPLATGPGATVFVGVSAPTADSVTTCRRGIPEVQSANGGCEERSNVVESSRQQRRQQSQHQHQQAAHIVKIKINPDGDKNSRVISTVRLTLDENERNCEVENNTARERSDRRGDGAVVVSATNLMNERHCASAGVGEGCVRISVFSGDPAIGPDNQERNNNNGGNDKHSQENDMVHRGTTETLNASTLGGRSSACFYYNSYQSPLSSMVMSSGQCSPSDTLDSGTCSDLDGTPPPLPKKKNASTVILPSSTHNRTGSLTSSGAEVDSDDNESNISCDSLNGEARDEYRMHETPKDVEETVGVVEKLGRVTLANGLDDAIEESNGVHHQVSITELGCTPRSPASVSPSPSGTSSLSKASSTPRVRSPDPAIEQNGQSASSPVIKECTYEERKQREQERIEQECVNAAQNRSTGHKYLYEDDRYYNFHVNELRGNNKNTNGEHGATENDECFAGYKIHDKEAIRSAKGTVRGVKNRVRAGIATFLQSPTSKV